MRSMTCDKRPRDEAVEMVNDPLKFDRGFDPFWDSTSNVFLFSDFELAYIGGVGWFPQRRGREQILEQMHIIHPRKECFDNGLVSLEFTYSRYGKKEGFSDY
ncbi:hypothetical protein H5410_064874 [Solanum commersonii]|uniref:Uncharacterized protein n=1 Tax=Solanum commersonii TaxID=4109 RepID=A0A9J5VYS3_SOLCO|nr:hypothetical protein H5410_064874 [Solanum commersonii]